MQTILVLKGCPGCGKSTIAKQMLVDEPNRWRRVNKDDLRNMFDGKYIAESDPLVLDIHNKLVKMFLLEGSDIIVDNTNLQQRSLNKIHRIAEERGDVTVIEKCIEVPLEECLRRNALRQGDACVPENIVRAMYKSFQKHTNKEAYYPCHESIFQNKMLPKAVICDLDGTLALLNGRNPYDASKCESDIINTPVLECIRAMALQGYEIIFMSGRENKYRYQTLNFLAKYYSFFSGELYMRKTGDQRQDSIVKRELFDEHVKDKFYVEFLLDDRNQVVNSYRNMGLTVFQVADGDF